MAALGIVVIPLGDHIIRDLTQAVMDRVQGPSTLANHTLACTTSGAAPEGWYQNIGNFVLTGVEMDTEKSCRETGIRRRRRTLCPTRTRKPFHSLGSGQR